jgi:hypothetical protein
MPSLVDGNVNPKTSYTNDHFNFTVKYSDPENKAPSIIIVRITGASRGGFNMLEADPNDQNYLDEKIYFYNISLSSGRYSYYFAASDGNYWVETDPILDEPIVKNHPPWIKITSPSDSAVKIDDEIDIEWTAEDIDDDANISLFYDTDNMGFDGILIASNISEDSLINSYTWNTSLIPEGTYYIYAVIDDDVNNPYSNYSIGYITIRHSKDNGDLPDNEQEEPSEDDESKSTFPEWFYLLLLIGIIIIIILILVIFILVKRKREPEEPTEPSVEPEQQDKAQAEEQEEQQEEEHEEQDEKDEEQPPPVAEPVQVSEDEQVKGEVEDQVISAPIAEPVEKK